MAMQRVHKWYFDILKGKLSVEQTLIKIPPNWKKTLVHFINYYDIRMITLPSMCLFLIPWYLRFRGSSRLAKKNKIYKRGNRRTEKPWPKVISVERFLANWHLGQCVMIYSETCAKHHLVKRNSVSQTKAHCWWFSDYLIYEQNV